MSNASKTLRNLIEGIPGVKISKQRPEQFIDATIICEDGKLTCYFDPTVDVVTGRLFAMGKLVDIDLADPKYEAHFALEMAAILAQIDQITACFNAEGNEADFYFC